MAAGELRLLRIFAGQLVPDAVKKLDVALLRILFHCIDERPGHSTCGLSGDGCISPVMNVSKLEQSRLNVTAVGQTRTQEIGHLTKVTQRDSQL